MIVDADRSILLVEQGQGEYLVTTRSYTTQHRRTLSLRQATSDDGLCMTTKGASLPLHGRGLKVLCSTKQEMLQEQDH